MFCPNCRFVVSDNDVFCPDCGTRIRPAAAQSPAQPAAKKTDLKSLLPLIVSILVVLIAAVVIIDPFGWRKGTENADSPEQMTAASAALSTQAYRPQWAQTEGVFSDPEPAATTAPSVSRQDLIGVWTCSDSDSSRHYFELSEDGSFVKATTSRCFPGSGRREESVTLIDATGSWWLEAGALQLDSFYPEEFCECYAPTVNGDRLDLDGGFFGTYYRCGEMPAPTDYLLFQEDCSWEQARRYCKELGGHLVTITSAEEERKLISMAEQADALYIWIGGRIDPYSGDVNWVTGEPSYFTDFGPHQPSFYDSDGVTPECELVLWFVSKYVGNDDNIVTGWGWNDVNVNAVVDYYSGRDKIFVLCEFNDGYEDIDN